MLKDSPKKKILIVEDEELLLEMYQEAFEKQGFEVLVATDSQEGLNKAVSEKPDLVLLDILLPGNDGTYFLEQRKESAILGAIPVVAFSNFDDPHIEKQARNLGIQDYLMKTDYTPQELVKKVSQYLAKE